SISAFTRCANGHVWQPPKGHLVATRSRKLRMAALAVAPRTWPQGLNAAERIKAEMERNANPENPEEEEEVFDELLWRQNVTDLHRVMEVAKSLWLLLEHSNEAMVRVALEIALDGTYKKVLWWPDFWFSDHDKREYFKEIVRIKLAIAVANAKGSAVDLTEFQRSDDTELVNSLRKQIADLEAALREARAKQEAAEARCRDLEKAAEEAAQRIAAMEKSLDDLRKEVKEYRNSMHLANNEESEELARLKQQLKTSEEERAKLEDLLSQLRKQLQDASKTGGDSDKLNSELEMAKRRIEELENRLKEAQKEIAALKRPKPGAPEPAPSDSAAEKDAMRKLREELKEERRKREEAEELLRKAQEQLELLRKEIEAERKKAADLSAELKRALDMKGEKPPDVVTEIKQVTVPGGLTEQQLAELEELRAKAEELEKLKAKLKKRDQQIAALQEENDKLQEEQVRLLKMLKQVKEQLRIVMELAEKKGFGDIIKKLFEEAGLASTMSDPDYTCFDRLYDDALRRMDKQRRLEWYRMGNTGEPPASFKAKHSYRRRESPERQADQKQNRGGPVYCRNCGSPVEVPIQTSSPSLPPTRSPSPSPYDSAVSTYYQSGTTQMQHSYSNGSLPSHRSPSPPSRSLSPAGADLRIESVRPAGGGHIALSVATWGDRTPWRPGQPFHQKQMRSRTPEQRAQRPERGSLPPLRDPSSPQGRAMPVRSMMGSSSAVELRREVPEARGRLRGAMFVHDVRPFKASEFTGEDPRMLWRPQKSFPLKDAPGTARLRPVCRLHSWAPRHNAPCHHAFASRSGVGPKPLASHPCSWPRQWCAGTRSSRPKSATPRSRPELEPSERSERRCRPSACCLRMLRRQPRRSPDRS
ncbi:unnamed protein product, partial [Effrenium voratum]